MASAGFTLADRLGARTVPCSVRGCTRTWICLTSNASKLGGRPPARDDDAGSGMCDPCREKFHKVRDRQQPCARPGCAGTWTWPAMDQLEAWAARQQPPKALCTACEAELAQLQDVELACVVPGCQRTAKVSAREQLLRSPAQQAAETVAPVAEAAAPVAEAAAPAAEAAAPAAETAAPVAEGESASATEGESAPAAEPARVAEVAPAAEAAATEPPAPVRLSAEAMCGQCAAVYRKLRDRPVTCGINGCKRKWIWTADEQIQAYAAGLTNEPPRRMCDECRVDFGNIADREIKCRTSGCKKTWTWARGDQLDACVAGKPAPKAPARMCQSCLDIWSRLKDIERPCRRAGCERTWTDKRGAQLARAVRGKPADPYPRYCDKCEGELGELEDRVMACKTENCSGTWVWSKAQQLAAGVRPPGQVAAEEAAEGAPKKRKKRREPRPPERRCDECNEFLKDLKTAEIPCTQCGTPIYWPPESQLQEHRGNWAHPTLCGACKRDVTEAARAVQREALRLSAPTTFGHAPAADAPAGENGAAEAEPAPAEQAEAAAPEQAPPETSSSGSSA